MTQTVGQKELFVDFLQELYLKNKIQGLSALQEPSWQKFLSLSIPDRKSEAFQYVPVDKLYACTLPKQEEEVILPETSGIRFVFIEGKLSHELSSKQDEVKQVVVLSLQEALKGSYSHFFKHRLEHLIRQETDPFALLNGALVADGVFIYVPPKLQLKNPIECVFVNKGSLASARVHLFVGAESHVQVVVSSLGGGASLDFFDIHLEEKAQVSYTEHSDKSLSTNRFQALRASLKKESKLSTYLVSQGSCCLRYDYRVSLLGEGAYADLSGLGFVGSSCHLHVNVHMDHSAPSCKSRQLFKHVVFSEARASFTGKIYVRPAAQKTEAYQLNKNLILSDSARIYSKPNLEIFADDVKASHGSTISQLDEDEMFYLRARGIPSSLAAALLTEGFCQEVIDKVPHEELQDKLRMSMKNFLLEAGNSA